MDAPPSAEPLSDPPSSLAVMELLFARGSGPVVDELLAMWIVAGDRANIRNRLGPTRRQIQALYYADVCRLNLKETAEKMGVSCQSVHALLRRARQAQLLFRQKQEPPTP